MPMSSAKSTPTILPMLIALALAAVVAVTIRGADVAGLAVARMWGELVFPVAHGGTTQLGPIVAALTTVAVIAAAQAMLMRLGLLDNVRETPLALGIVGRDLPFLLAGMVFVALYASLADGLARTSGAPSTPVPTDPLTLISLILLVPIAQEMLLRGGLLPSLERLTGTASAIVLCALAGLPAAAPVPELLLLALVPQLFFGWMAWSCRSLGAAAVLHASYIVIRLYLAG